MLDLLLLPFVHFVYVLMFLIIGMFGVFCDLFSFTMTYAILKLITSLCYPSMASVAAVAAMASATSSSSSSFQSNPVIMTPNFSATTIAPPPSFVPIVLPFPVNNSDYRTNLTQTSVASTLTSKLPTTFASTNAKPTTHDIFYNDNHHHQRGGDQKSLNLRNSNEKIDDNSGDDNPMMVSSTLSPLIDDQYENTTITTTTTAACCNNNE